MAGKSRGARTVSQERRAFTERDLRDLYRHKVRFCQHVLHLPPNKAREWAREAVRAARAIG